MAENKQIINSNDMWQNLRFCYHTMGNLKAIYFHGELGSKQDLNSVLFELVAKKYTLAEDDPMLNELINNKVNKYYLTNGRDDGAKAYWKAYEDLLSVAPQDEDFTLLYVLNPAHPLRKAVGDELLMEAYTTSYVDYATSGAMLIFTTDTPNEVLDKLVNLTK